MFTVYPAIDLRHGRCVRLRQGRADAETVFSDDPAATARHWQERGAHWLHVVNLDGAIDTGDASGPNLAAIKAILAAVSVPVELGGGVRSLDTVVWLLDLGATRVILGTVAVTQPEIVPQAIARFGAARIVVSLDARDGIVATHGWVAASGLRTEALGRQLAADGVTIVVHTDIARDGMLSGANVAASTALAEATGLSVIVSGGVASLDDVTASARAAHRGVAGVIVGQALYTGAFDLADAIRLAERESVAAPDGGSSPARSTLEERPC
ncbi:MAG: 1-(5-phosphoribosyl)-5-[(5-phosphoribosylamino)methylideneamino]imidazole-4-carboxamide isomerase [Anaerolineae bacterium]